MSLMGNGYRNVGLNSSKMQKFRIFGKNLPARDTSPCATVTKLDTVEGVRGLYPSAKVHGCGFTNVGLLVLKLPKLVLFGTV